MQNRPSKPAGARPRVACQATATLAEPGTRNFAEDAMQMSLENLRANFAPRDHITSCSMSQRRLAVFQ